MIATSDGNFIIAGSTSSYGAGNFDVFLLKVDQNGDTIWTKTYGGALDDGGSGVFQAMDGGYLIVGTTMSFTTGFSSMYAIKTNNLGDAIWTKTFEKESATGGFSAIQLSDGGFFFAGKTSLTGQMITSDCFLVRTDILGDTIWTKTFGGSDYDGAFCAQKTNAGNIVISGTSKSWGTGGYDIFLSLFDTSGNELWKKTYGGVSDDYGGSFSLTNDGGFIITGYTQSFGSGGQDMYLIKANQFGDTLWTKTFGGFGDEWGGCVKQTLDNGYIISGNTSSFGNGNDVYLVKTNFDGISNFQQILYQKNSFNVYPNPSTGLIKIDCGKIAGTSILVRIFDVMGCILREQTVIINENSPIEVSLDDFASGTYLLQIYSDRTFGINRIIIQK